jgi:hypothetical protein
VTAILCTHRGATPITREALANVETPEATSTWRPVPHAELVNRLYAEFAERGIEVVREQLAIQSQGQLLFGVFDLNMIGPDGDFRGAFGFRTSNNKSLAIRAVAGLRVFVCDNLALSGDEQVLRRTHTSKLDIGRETAAAVDRFTQRNSQVADQVQVQKARTISDGEAKQLVYDAFTQKLLPLRLLPTVHQEYFEPSFPEFRDGPHSLWRLNNAFTFAAKDLGDGRRHVALNGLGRYFANLTN